MKTKTDKTTFVIAHPGILCCLLFAVTAFTALGDPLSLDTTHVDIKVRFVQGQPGTDWFDKFDWYRLAYLTGQSQMVTLTDAQLKATLKAIAKHDGADLVSEERVTTINGKQVQLRLSTTNNSLYDTTLDVVPTVADDSITIHLDLVPIITEYLGTNQSGAFVPSAVTNVSGSLPFTTIGLMLPHSRVHEITTSCTIKNGQTFVLSGLLHQRSQDLNTSPLIFVTATVVDSLGNPIIHPEHHFDGPVP